MADDLRAGRRTRLESAVLRGRARHRPRGERARGRGAAVPPEPAGPRSSELAAAWERALWADVRIDALLTQGPTISRPQFERDLERAEAVAHMAWRNWAELVFGHALDEDPGEGGVPSDA